MISVPCVHQKSIHRQSDAWCIECGSPLGVLELVSLNSDIQVGSDVTASCTVRLKNTGRGPLYTGISAEQASGIELPPGLTGYFALNRDEERRITVMLDGSRLRRGDANVNLSVWALDGERVLGSSPMDTRKTHTVPLSLVWVDRRPLLHPERLLVLEGGKRRQVTFHNQGNVAVQATLSCNGCAVEGENGISSADLTITVPSADSCTVPVLVKKGFKKATITVTGGSDTKQIEVIELKVPPPYTPLLPYTAGIDFGTSKSAVFFINNWPEDPLPGAPPTLPESVPWPDPIITGNFLWWLPSAVLYPADPTQSIQFGWGVPSSDGTATRSIKTKVREGAPIQLDATRTKDSEEVVEDFLRHVWNRSVTVISADARKTSGMSLPSSQILAVLAMPVGETTQAHTEQKERILRAAQKAFGRSVQIEMVREPECAAADFMLRGSEWGFVPIDSAKICVFDCGAGTTDVSIVQVQYSGDRPSFTTLCQVGYEFGGDAVDMLLAQALFKEAEAQGWIQQAADGKLTYLRTLGTADWEPFTTEQLCFAAKTAKEGLIYTSDRQAMNAGILLEDLFSRQEVTWQLVNRVAAPFLQAVFDMDGSHAFPPRTSGSGERSRLLDALKAQDLNPYEVDWVCLTGGSVLIPEIIEHLDAFFEQANFSPPLDRLTAISADPDRPLTKNVARGSASLLQTKTPDMLGFEVGLRLQSETESEERPEALRQGATADGQINVVRPLNLPSDTESTLYVTAKLPGESEPRTIWASPLPIRDTPGRLLPKLAYVGDGRVTLQVSQLNNGNPIPVA